MDEDSLRRLNSELGNSRGEPTTIMEDNQSCIVMAKIHSIMEGQST